MVLIYFDESKSEPDHEHYHLGAVCVDEADIRAVEARVAGIVEQAFGSSALTSDTELHAAEIYHRKRHFKDWSDFEERIGLLARLVDVLSLPEVMLIDIHINCKLLYTSQPASDIAFMFLCEKANSLVKERDALGMLIGDRESDRFAERYALALSEYRLEGTDFQFGREISHLVDSVHFTHSHLSRLLQLADVYCWVLQFQLRNADSDNLRHRAVFEMLRRDNVDLFPRRYREWPR